MVSSKQRLSCFKTYSIGLCVCGFMCMLLDGTDCPETAELKADPISGVPQPRGPQHMALPLRYLPVDLEYGSRRENYEGPGPCAWLSCSDVCSGQIGEPVEYQPAEWLPEVQKAWWYQISSFAYCVVGTAVFIRPEPTLACIPFFPVRTVGVLVFINGWLSYMGDYHTWGVWSRWKAADIVLATTNTLLQMGIVAMAMLGYAEFPPEAPTTLGVSLVIALCCKRRGSAAVARRDCAGFLRWHALWHYTLPLGAFIASQYLLQMPTG